MTNPTLVDRLLHRHNKCATSKYDPVSGPTVFSEAVEEICRLELRVKGLERALNALYEESDNDLLASEPNTIGVSLEMVHLLRRLWVNEPCISYNFVIYREWPYAQASGKVTNDAVQKEFNDLIKAIEKEIIYPSLERPQKNTCKSCGCIIDGVAKYPAVGTLGVPTCTDCGA